jgi:peptidylprolyl isomerase
MFRPALALLWCFAVIAVIATATGSAQAAAPENHLYLDLPDGRVTIQLMPDLAPEHVKRVKRLVREHFYDGLTFHRVISGFMAQTGDPTGSGNGGSNYPNLKAEFSDYTFRRGTVAMARTQDPNSANSQFFICFTNDGCSSLNGQYTVWGQVTNGMEHVDRIAVGEPPSTPDRIIKMKLADEQPPPSPEEQANFDEVVRTYRAAAKKPVLPEDAHKFKVQAESAVREKQFDEAIGLYAQALKVAPWWPAGHFNRALLLAETDAYADAIAEMKRYLLLVPDASDARAAQDKVYEWERKAQ